ncbi:hypothetical protein FKM82_027098 [Ascaphus truei]
MAAAPAQCRVGLGVMAAAVLAEGSVGAGFCGIIYNGHGSAGSGQGPAAWSRSLERALEEAAVTGALSLSGRKLRDFPRSAARQDLTDTTQAGETGGRNQLTSLPAHLCSLPLKVLIASNNKLDSLPEEIGLLRQLTELDVSCNDIQVIPTQIGKLESLRDLNIRRNHLLRLPEEVAELPLVRLDFSCNNVTVIPVCYRNLRHLQTITLDNNPLQSPPAQICIKGKIHIFKYLNIEACKSAPDLPDYDRRPLGFSTCFCLSFTPPTDEFSDLPLRAADAHKEQRLRREQQPQENRVSSLITNGGVEHDLDQIDYIDSYATEEEEEEARLSRAGSLSSQFMAYIEERRVSHEGSPAKQTPAGNCPRSEGRRQVQLTRDGEELRRPESLSLTHDRERQPPPRSQAQRLPLDATCLLSRTNCTNQADVELQRSRELLEATRRDAQLAALHYEEERMKSRHIQRDSTHDLVKSDERSAMSPVSPTSQTIHLSSPATAPSNRYAPQRPESFLFRATVREDGKRGNTPPPSAPADPRAGLHSKQRREELEVTEQLRKNIESRLKVSLPNDLGAALTDGVVLCHLANHVRPRSVPSIHVPSPAVPKLTMAKCRRNVENFLDACRRIGVPQDKVCLPSDILQLNHSSLTGTLESLLSYGESSPAAPSHLLGFGVFYCTLMLLLFLLYRWVLASWTQA